MKKDETTCETVQSILDNLQITKRCKNKLKKPLTQNDVNKTDKSISLKNPDSQKDENPMTEHNNLISQNDDDKEDLQNNQAEPEVDNTESEIVKTDDNATAKKKRNKHKRSAAKRNAQKKKKAAIAAAQSTADPVPNLDRSDAVFDNIYHGASTLQMYSHNNDRHIMIELPYGMFIIATHFYLRHLESHFRV